MQFLPAKWAWIGSRILGKIWAPVVGYGLVGVAVALAAPFVPRFLPSGLTAKIGAGAVEPILTILATSMLSVTTFSLSIMVAAYSAAAGGATPRAIQLLQGDRTTQRVLASFIGAFVFSLVGIVATSAGVYGEEGRFVLFLVTIAMIVAIVVNLIRWVQHLTNFGRLTDTVERMEDAFAQSFAERLAEPSYGAHPGGRVPSGARPVLAHKVGYVQHLDVGALAKVAKTSGARIYVAAVPGDFVHAGTTLACVVEAGRMPEDVQRDEGGAEDMSDAIFDAVRNAFTLEQSRTFDQDPQFGAIALSEVASRALSPAVNDPGTAIDVLGRLVRVLSTWPTRARPAVRHVGVWVPVIDPANILSVAMGPIARDGAALREVMIHVIEALAALDHVAHEAYGAGVRAQAARAVDLARNAMAYAPDWHEIADLAATRGLITRADYE